ncbi:hypothetical protein DEU56DRAFT_836123 [Suillus clintonianus]|uniref:uncharacterized protein n=1 Tax=Suillus clintonianus TaxID=1904413 RepID=UPI001B867E55|nr:uncharacterized protein DEU56DRAFT_836123 [Suillus clintonianus]KAG2119436.1 hypothetical protein DEU56DRAFT_836123 [Suillus clintonianus]
MNLGNFVWRRPMTVLPFLALQLTIQHQILLSRDAGPTCRFLNYSFLYGDQRLRSFNPCYALVMSLIRIQLWTEFCEPPV